MWNWQVLNSTLTRWSFVHCKSRIGSVSLNYMKYITVNCFKNYIEPILKNIPTMWLCTVIQIDELCDHLASTEEADSLVLRNTGGTDESIAKISKSLRQSKADIKASWLQPFIRVFFFTKTQNWHCRPSGIKNLLAVKHHFQQEMDCELDTLPTEQICAR